MTVLSRLSTRLSSRAEPAAPAATPFESSAALVRECVDGEGSVKEGDTVEFKIDFDDRKGKDQAVKVRAKGGGGRGRSDSRGRSRSRGGGGGGGGGRGNYGKKMIGRMITWHSDKGFGFIKPDDGGADVFCHASGLRDGEGSVRDGDTVEFVIQEDPGRGKDRAVSVAKQGSSFGGRRGGRDPSDSRSRSPSRRKDPRRRSRSR